MKTESNPELNPGVTNQSNPAQDDYSFIEKKIAMQQMMHNSSNEIIPETPIDTAHLLIGESELTKLMPERDKDIILSNLNSFDSFIIDESFSLYDDIKFMIKQQEIRNRIMVEEFPSLYDVAAINKEIEIAENTERGDYVIFDRTGTLKKGIRTGFIKRATQGFERTKQVETITQYKMENIDKTEKAPGFMAKFMGGFRR